ncbi:histidine decarboxylase, pyruvoyl type [uncultured Mediterranean phage]|nr:histidine decarboxylase, pyruvoyl type [uncultured Mediterranean phage]
MTRRRRIKYNKRTRKKRGGEKRGGENQKIKRMENIILGAIGPYKKNCAAFGNPSGPHTHNYINICKLGIGKVKLDKSTQGWDTITKGILAYDRAETNGTYLGQLNVVAASSFIGPYGALWGYDIANNTNNANAMYSIDNVPIYDIDPLLEAGEALFGTNQKTTEYYGQMQNTSTIGSRFYIMPGEIQPCAVKSAKKEGSGVIWSAIGIGIPVDSLLDKVARLFYEDAGSFSSPENPTQQFIEESKQKLDQKMKTIASAMIKNGRDQIIPIEYSKIFIGFKMLPVMSDEYATAITLSPYITLAKEAVPHGNPRLLAHMSLKQWEKEMKFH